MYELRDASNCLCVYPCAITNLFRFTQMDIIYALTGNYSYGLIQPFPLRLWLNLLSFYFSLTWLSTNKTNCWLSCQACLYLKDFVFAVLSIWNFLPQTSSWFVSSFLHALASLSYLLDHGTVMLQTVVWLWIDVGRPSSLWAVLPLGRRDCTT